MQVTVYDGPGYVSKIRRGLHEPKDKNLENKNHDS
jgi:hypothetical protein